MAQTIHTPRIAALLLAGVLVLSGGSRAQAAPGAASPDTSESWTAVPLPDGTLMYVRYGTPGGVRIESHHGVPDSVEMADSLALSLSVAEVAGVDVTGGAPGADEATNRENLARMRQTLREELARHAMGRGGPGGGTAWVGNDNRPGGQQTIIIDRTPPPAVAVVTPPPASEPVPPVPPTTVLPVPITPPVPVVVPPAPTPPPPAPERTVETRVIREQFLEGGLFRTNLILFESDRAELMPFSRDVVQAIGDVLRDFPGVRIRVEGHTDNRGTDAYNLELSRRRADSVRSFLIEKSRLGADQIEAAGFGEERPIARGDNATVRALNRRVEFRILNPEVLKRVLPE